MLVKNAKLKNPDTNLGLFEVCQKPFHVKLNVEILELMDVIAKRFQLKLL